MATNTALILFGSSHPNDGGLTGKLSDNPTLRLSEGSRPCWIFRPGDFFRSQQISATSGNLREFLLVPTLEYTLEEGLLLTALVLYHDHAWGAAASRMRDQLLKDGRLELYPVEESLRAEAREEVREHSAMFPKMVLSVLEKDSLIHSQIRVLSRYEHEMAVCMPIFTRNRSQWSSCPHETGALESLSPIDSSWRNE